MHSFTLAGSLGIDSLLASAVIATRPLTWRIRILLALAFGSCDALATALSATLISRSLQLFAVLAWCLLSAVFVFASRSSVCRLIGFALFLSLDNLLTPSTPELCIAAGAGSAAMAFGGTLLGSLFRTCAPARPSDSLARNGHFPAAQEYLS